MSLRYQVPQFIDIEDKIVGPLTLKQFLIYFAAVMLLIPVYLFSDLSLFLTLALPVLGIAAAFAHFKPGGKSLARFLAAAAAFASRSRLWVWRRTAQAKPLLVQGIELREEGVNLQQKAQQIETGGNVQAQADVEDPLLEEKSQIPIGH